MPQDHTGQPFPVRLFYSPKEFLRHQRPAGANDSRDASATIL